MSFSTDIMDNFEKYAELTRNRDWKGIQEWNGTILPASFGIKKELSAIPEYLHEGEVVFALASGVMSQTSTSNMADFGVNTWLVLLTNERFLFLDAALLSNSVDTQSIRHPMVQAVSASQGWILGKISIDLGSRLVVVDNCQKKDVKVMAELADKWLRELEQRDPKSAISMKRNLSLASNPNSQESPLDKLAKLQELYAAGALSDEEFSSIKENILGEM